MLRHLAAWMAMCGMEFYLHFLSLKSVTKGAGQAMDFTSTILQAGKERAVAILCMVLLWIAYVVVDVCFDKRNDGEEIKVGFGIRRWCYRRIIIVW